MLLSSTQKLQVVLSGAVATAQLPIVAGWADSAGDASTLAPASATGATNSTTAVDIVPAPAATFLRQLKYLSIYNADTAAATITVRVDVAGTPRILCVVTLAVGSRLEYTAEGFRAFDSTGALVGSGGGGSGSGDVVGPASAVDDRIATFDSATGKLIKDGGKTIADLRSPSIQSVTSSATVTPTFSDDIVLVLAQAVTLALANPTGTAIPNLGMVIRIKDNGTARAINYDTQYRAVGITLPTTTVIGKTTYLAMIYNSTDTKWDVLAVGQQA